MSRSARPRSTTGASSAGPVYRGSPSTKSPQRRHRHASPRAVSTRSRSRSRASTPSPAGANVSWPRREQWRLFQSRMADSVGAEADTAKPSGILAKVADKSSETGPPAPARHPEGHRDHH